MRDLILDIAHNLTHLLAMGFIYGLLLMLRGRVSSRVVWQVLVGVLFGFGALLCMQMPITFWGGVDADGQAVNAVIVDLRIAAIALAGPFGGTLATIVAAVIAIAYRIEIGGPGALAGVMALASAAAVGLLARLWIRRRGGALDLRRALVLGLVLVPVSLAWTFILPAPLDPWAILARMWAPVAVMYPLGVMGLGVTLRQIDRFTALTRALSQSGQRFRRLFIGSPDGILIANPQSGLIIDANPAAAALLGRSVEELIGMHQATLHPADWADRARETFAQHIEESRQGGPVTPIGAEFLRPDGERVPVEAVAQVMEVDGGEVMVGYFRDLRERRKAQRALQAAHALTGQILDTADAMIVGLDAEGEVLLFSDGAERISGYTRDQLAGCNWFETVLPVAERGQVHEMYQGLLATGEPRAYENRIVGADGQERLIAWRNGVLPPEHEMRVIGVGIDVTAQRQAEEQLRQSTKMQAVGQLAGGVAHDFNNQLQIIGGYVHLLSRAVADDGQREMLGVIQDASRRSADLVAKLLAFSRKAPATRRTFDLGALVRDALTVFERGVDKRIAVRFDLPAEPVLIDGDETSVQSALLNLVLNARDAMPDGGDLQVACALVEHRQAIQVNGVELAPGRYAQLQVRDNGIGMEPAICERIFEPFFTTKEIGQGTGLGLPAVYGTVVSHGGSVMVESEAGKGTCFTLLLPLSDQMPTAGSDDGPLRSDDVGTRILIVDDEQQIGDLWCMALGEQGYTCHHFTDGAAALVWADEHLASVDLALVDLNMPGMSGNEVIRGLRQRRPTLPIIIGTGLGPEGLADDVAGEDHVRLLYKPFGIDALSRMIDEMVDG